MKIWVSGCALMPFLAAATPAGPSREPVATVTFMPPEPIIEVRDGSHIVNFDMILTNRSNVTLRLAKVELDVRDATGALASRRSINTDAFAPSIAVIGKQVLAPGESLDVFNPFPEFAPQVPLDHLAFSFCLQRESDEAEHRRNLHRLPDDCDDRVGASATPRIYDTKTPLVLPLEGKVFVWEGHDLLAHHLRVPFGNPKVQALGITANSNEFAGDFIYTDAAGHEYRGDPRRLEAWYSYGKPVYAPGAGRVIGAADDIPDNWFEDTQAARIGHPRLPAGKDSLDIGNFVLIDHGDGEFSLLIHMKPGSVRVRVGDPVDAGRQIGQIGFSGDAIFPHLHYSLMAGATDTKSWGLPAYFSRFHRIYGAKSFEVARGPVNSGDFVESDARY